MRGSKKAAVDLQDLQTSQNKIYMPCRLHFSMKQTVAASCYLNVKIDIRSIPDVEHSNT